MSFFGRNMNFIKLLVRGVGTTPYVAFFVGLSIGLLFFIVTFGLSVVNPQNTEWILASGGDLAQHQLGWDFFRDSEWTFPLGIASDLAYPFGIPVTFMDSIPLFALIFKLLSPVLPDSFQYLGLFTVISFALQGGVSAIILQRFTKNIWIISLGSLLFLLTPMLIMRSFVHTALTAHWIILTGIYVIIRYERKKISFLRFVLIWTTLMTVSVLVHPYFFPMTFVLAIISLVRSYSNEEWWLSCAKIIIPASVAVAVFAGIGGLLPAGDNLNKIDLDIYSMNLVSPVDPMGYSSLTSRNLYVDSRDGIPETSEKLNYLGIGVIVMLVVLLSLLVKRYAGVGESFLNDIKKMYTPRNILTALVLFGLLVFSLGSHIKFGSTVIVQWPLPDMIEKLWLTFRSSARMFWPIYYMIIIFIFICFIRAFRALKPAALVIFILFFVLLQVVDIRLSTQFRNKKEYVASASSKEYKASNVASVIASNYCDKGHLISLSPYLYLEEFITFSQPALKCDMTVTEGYYSHHYKRGDISRYQNMEKEKLISGVADTRENLYLTTDVDFVKRISSDYKVKQVDNWYIIE